MNINNNHQQNTNFGVLKKMKFTPLRYYSRDSKNILKNAFEQNESFQEFCNKYDTKIVFSVKEREHTDYYYKNWDVDDHFENILSSMEIFFKKTINKDANLAEKITHFFTPYKLFFTLNQTGETPEELKELISKWNLHKKCF